jgi:hypothetical protein
MTEEEKKKQAAAVEQGQQPDSNVTPTPPTPTAEEGDGITSFTVKGGDGQTYTNRATADGGRETVDEKGNVVHRINADGTQWNAPESMSGQLAASSQKQGASPTPAPSPIGRGMESAETTETPEETPTATADDALDELERENEERLRKGKEIYESMFRPTETEAERNQREKREKTLRIVAGIHDMTRALANLYGTVRYAPSWYDGNNLSDKAKERYERAKTEREKDRAYNDNLRMVLNKLEGDYNNMKLNIEREKARRAEAAGRAAETARHNKAMEEAKEKDREAKKEEGEANRQSKEKISRNRPRSSGRGSGSGAGGFTISGGYNDDGTDHGGYMIPQKTLDNSIGTVYAMLPKDIREDNEYNYRGKKLSAAQMKDAVENFLGSKDYTDSQKRRVRQALYNLEHMQSAPNPTQGTKTQTTGGSSKSKISIHKKK